MANWTRIEKLNGGERIYYVDPPIDSKKEVWFFSGDSRLRIWSDGVLYKGDEEKVAQVTAPVTERFSLYKLLDQLFVDVEVRGEQAVIHRGVLNGSSVAALIAPSEVEPLLARYRALSFRDGTPWNATKKRVTVREYRKDSSDKWTVHVDGTSVIENMRKETPTPSREAAIALAQKRIQAKQKAGFRTYLIELIEARHPNPEPKPPKGVPARKPLAKKAAIAKPKNAFEAVDAAVAILKDLHTRIPKAHFVTECLDAKKDRERITSVESHASFFLGMHKQRVGRWKTAKPRAPKKNESSWDYFVRVYGSITWILDGQADEGLAMFYCGNVTGGGWSCLEIVGEGDYEIDDLVEATGNEELEQLLVFHGGWHDGTSWAFDQRVSSPSGEYAIIPFDESMDALPKQMKPERIVPFGDWLYKRVVSLTRIAERNLREVN